MSLKKTSRKPPTFLNVNKAVGTAGLVDPTNTVYVNILEVEVSGESAGIRMESNLPEMCPPYEEHTVRKVAGYTQEEWYALHYMERALEVAHYRIERKAEAIIAERMKEKNN